MQLEVTQADRDAAHDLLYRKGRNVALDQVYEAFARHRLTTSDETARLREENERLKLMLQEERTMNQKLAATSPQQPSAEPAEH